MKKYHSFKLILLLLFFAVLNLRTGCYKENIDIQVKMQEVLCNVNNPGKCWTLNFLTDSLEYLYYQKYYDFDYKLTSDGQHVIYVYYNQYDEVRTPFTYDIQGDYQTDNDPTDCSDEDKQPNHTFYRTSDYPNLKRKAVYEFYGTNYTIKEGSAVKPNIKDSSYYYYEELYFDLSGKFKKRIFLNSGCNPIEITGNWRFRTPFARIVYSSNGERTGESEAELILDYDRAPIAGLPPSGNLYTLRFSDNFDDMLISQNTKSDEVVSSVLRGDYTLSYDHILFSPNLDAIHHWSAQGTSKGKVKNHWSSLCGFQVNTRGDLIEIVDSIELLLTKAGSRQSFYNLKAIRCSTPAGNCPLFCNLTLCGNFNADIFDSDNKSTNQPHKSDLSITADSTILTITNFAKLGGSLNVVMTPHVWVSCYTDAFTATVSGTTINFENLTVETNTSTMQRYLVAYYRINGVSYRIHYTL